MSLTEKIRDLRSSLKDSQASPEDRRSAALEARALMVELEDEGDILTRVNFGGWETVCLDIGVRMGLLRHLVAKSRSTAAELAQLCGSEDLLTDRVLKCLASWNAVNIFKENGQVYYAANGVTKAYASPRGELYMRWCQGTLHAGWLHIPQRLEETGFKSIRTAINSVYSELKGQPDLLFWQILTDSERKDFQNFMPVFNLEHLSWLKVYPVEQQLIEGMDKAPDAVLLVDVGGNTGSQATAFATAFPQAPGRIISQDLQRVIGNLGANDHIELMAHDFFEPQPIQGARAYYLRYIMHDWSDEKNTEILSNLRLAMRPGYSKLLINDWLLADVGASNLMTSMDLCMMGVLGGIERTLEQHERYIKAAGLKITGVWNPEDGRTEGVIECMVDL